MDDGKMNAFGFDFIKAFNAALDEAEREKACSVLIIGNKKALSAGFDLSSVMDNNLVMDNNSSKL